MPSESQNSEYYQALVQRDSQYEGVFYAGIKTTGIFCRPTCPARKPKEQNCEFFAKVQDALLAGYRPCKRCQPMSQPNAASPAILTLIESVEKEPERRWSDADFRALGIDASTVRRQFKKRFGMTFVAYARARRMGLALKKIRDGSRVIDTQLDSGYDSGSGFRDAFAKIMGSAPQNKDATLLKAHWLDSPLGPILTVADEEGLILSEFTDRRGLEREIEKLRSRLKAAIVPGTNLILESIEAELAAYFAGELTEFKTPLKMIGSEFQKAVWKSLQRIPFGETRSYAKQAEAIGNPKAVRAVARANGMNQIAIVIPCHRVIGSDGSLTGYAGGLPRKQWLLEHESRVSGKPIQMELT
ncbi:methylated-DNA--[protein]-cysteine S-methyltransferase [Pelagicoccus albus]|uniref:Methylated-DNA--protein-cysteine methyltransferase n=1 Tax=Pelagicoccus albus TaxID=415222 RepID=A0A7X1B7A6_9BACT|nr:bifunctional transcriptional activator/DNA repair protein Ada [Pelagicoccus albus]